MKAKRWGNELTEADVTHISLVKRAATQQAFKILKSATPPPNRTDAEKPMAIDLGKILFAKKAPPAPPTIAAVFVTKGASEAVLAKLAKHELEFPVRYEVGEIVVAAPKDQDATKLCKSDAEGNVGLAEDFKAVLFKMDDDTLVAVSGEHVRKFLDAMPYSSTKFQEVLGVQGVYPMLCCATEALSTTMSNILAAAETREAAVNDIGAAAVDYGNYVKSVVAMLPEQLLKADLAEPVAVEPKAEDKPKAEVKTEGEKAPEQVAKTDGDETAGEKVPAEVKPEGDQAQGDPPEKVAKTGEDESEQKPGGEGEKPDADGEAPKDQVLKADDVVGALKPLLEELKSGLVAQIAVVQKTADEAKEAAALNAGALQGLGTKLKATVPGAVALLAPKQAQGTKEQVAKDDGGGDGFHMFDTAIHDPFKDRPARH
jgi:hypothetical protein